MDAPLLARRAPRRQRGAIAVLAALGLGLMVIMLSILDIGFLYYYKREYQKAADLAAMAGAVQMHQGCGEAKTRAAGHAAANLGSVSHSAVTPACGIWRRNEAPPFTPDEGDGANAIRVVVAGTAPRFFIPGERLLQASAVALADQPAAALIIQTQVLSLNAERSAILNAVTGGLLGGSLNLGVAGWQGLLNTDVNLLTYMEALALSLGLDVGDYDGVLGSSITVGELADVATNVLNQGGGTGDIALAVGALDEIAASVGAASLQLGDLIAIGSGTEAAGLDTGLNLFQLVNGMAQLAGGNNVADVDLNLLLPGVGGTIKLGIIEPPRISAVGNPELAAADPMGPDRIMVRTAQVRGLVSLDLPITSALNSLLSNALVDQLANVVNDLLSLNLLGLLSNLLCIGCERNIIDVQIVPMPRVDLAIDAGAATAHVNDYTCGGGSKSLTVPVNTSLARIRIGSFGASEAEAAAAAFSTNGLVQIAPVPLVDIGTRRVRRTCILICSTSWWNANSQSWVSSKANSTRQAFVGGGVGLRLNVPLGGGSPSPTPVYSQPPEGGLPNLTSAGTPLPPAWQSFNTSGLVNSLAGAVNGVEVEYYEPQNQAGLGALLALVGSVADPLVDALSDAIVGLLGPLIDPIVDTLLETLGVDLNATEVGANMTCDGAGGILVD